jgi:hypothetical protein
MSDASLFFASSSRNQHLAKNKDMPQTSKASGVPEAFSYVL